MSDLVSIIIPMYNAEKTIVKTLNSVKSQIFNGRFEIFIINDGSTDNSQDIVEKYISENPAMNIQFFRQENKGVSSARNIGLKKAKGKFIALLDADDEWLPQKTQTQLDIFHQNLEIDFLASCRKNHIPKFPYHVNEKKLSKISFRKLLFRNETQPSTVIFRKEILEKIGYFNENQRYAEDVNFWLRVSKTFKMYLTAHQLTIADGGKRTFGVAGLSANLPMMHRGFIANLKFCLKQKWINLPEFYLYVVFYKLKYLVLLIRSL